jgi:hypothetical protein
MEDFSVWLVTWLTMGDTAAYVIGAAILTGMLR